VKNGTANERVDNSEKSMLRLSDDIGKMADQIGVMADRIGDMADRILETQKIQSKNVEITQQSMLEMMKIMSEQLKASNKII
jgi:archaellum component FlaC